MKCNVLRQIRVRTKLFICYQILSIVGLISPRMVINIVDKAAEREEERKNG
jgi:hypothetical protein